MTKGTKLSAKHRAAISRGKLRAGKVARAARKKRGNGHANLPAVIDAAFNVLSPPPPPRARRATIVLHPREEQAPLYRALLASLGVEHEG
jgi:hypothetical protein